MADQNQFGSKAGSSSGGELRCEEWEALLTDALDGLLPAARMAEFEAHSERCANCGDLLAHVKQGQEWLGYLHDEPEIPAALVGKILEKTVGAGGVPVPLVAAGAGVPAGSGAMALPWRRNFHEARLLMTVAMAFFSIALTLNLMGVKMGSLRLADLKPSEIGNTLSREFYGTRKSVVQYYDNVRFFYQLQSRMRELRRDVETQPQQPQQQPQQNQQNQQQKPAGKNGSAVVVERGQVLRAAQGTGQSKAIRDRRSAIGDRRSEERKKATVVLVSVGTGKSISLGHSRAGLRRQYVERGLV